MCFSCTVILEEKKRILPVVPTNDTGAEEGGSEIVMSQPAGAYVELHFATHECFGWLLSTYVFIFHVKKDQLNWSLFPSKGF